MAGVRRQAPDPEWVQMYRQGVPVSRIAVLSGAAEATVRYHLQIAARSEPSLRGEHARAVQPVPKKQDERGLKNVADIVALYRTEGRLPSSKSASMRERSLESWLAAKRQQSQNGTLSPAYRDGLREIPGWDTPRRQKEQREELWNQRFTELLDFRAAGNDWPLHKEAPSEQERLLGVWLHSQRITYRDGTLRQDREARLNTELPGWRRGRRPGRRPHPAAGAG
ncbi:helicase associated domain-containing protein [Arthrobacter nitrophenolicus]|uniref:Uncharacterized protein n=2 Tax=Arthrobacter nitrophenolicus TaxID=683150 RepID=A0ACC6TK85_9MICC|nr:helicase associated domain-containing protein [Arthrobacter nitrophenolicus]ELT42971.1 helicase-associated protein [Arthrobacter nitrophenolicus]